MHFLFKRCFIGMICPFFIAVMVMQTNGQILSVPAVGFDEAITPGANDSLSDDRTNVHSEDEIQNRIQRRLTVSPYGNGAIRVHVEQGETTLSGYVEDRDVIVEIIKIAYDSGATNVNNQLRLSDPTDHPWRTMTDQELKEAVEDELYWSPFVNTVPIRVETQNGSVTLSGRVENRGEIADAVENAYEAGAKQVRIHLWIDPTLD